MKRNLGWVFGFMMATGVALAGVLFSQSRDSTQSSNPGEKPEHVASNSEGEGAPTEDPSPTGDESDIPPPRTADRADERNKMVDRQIAARGISDEKILAALRNVPRHWFVPDYHEGKAYFDRPLGIGYGQTISQPYIVALMTEALDLEEGEVALEIGTGSGYQAAVLSELTANVYTIEIVEGLAEEVRKRFWERGYREIKTKHGDGYFGWEEKAPFDAIIVTCAASHIPPTLVKQLKPGGRMCIPVGGPFATQRLMLLTKQEDGTTRSKNLELVRFVPMTGKIEEM